MKKNSEVRIQKSEFRSGAGDVSVSSGQNQDARSLLASPLLTLGEANAKGEDSA
ncbi:MAG: hypothetical protein V7L23_11325 [Nostoc sp.]|uniref:hypothetical protein n=1 Tax=Nostoc sp. TaxID=1180 RepID=UPI002FEF7628